MATVWLNQSISSWNTPAAFSYWDENTQSIQSYGQTPQNGDTFYLNGYQITGNQNISIPNGKISNGTNPYTNRSGGNIFGGSTTRAISCKEIEVGDSYIATHQASSALTITFSANINLLGTGVLFYKGGNYAARVIVNGNLYRNSLAVIVTGNNGCSFTINGNYESETAVGSNVTASITINGNCILRNTSINGGTAVTDINISGDITVINSHIVASTSGTTTLSGHNIYYDGTIEPIRGLILNAVVFDSDDFSFHNINNEYKTYLLSKYQLNNTEQYPNIGDVREGVEYAFGTKIGTMTAVAVGCVTKEDVREGVPLLGMGEVGTLVVPSVDDVREGVVFDNGSVGTLIVEGGGERLRIADFGYYTNALSDTYIVDLTEQDKPKFAVAEERVLIEMFPDLDLDNISDKYFDDLFVKYLKYRLIVEYYRTAGINSTFTPSEPTVEIVNYQNVRNEVWLNSANIYLKAWSKKYPESIAKPQRILL